MFGRPSSISVVLKGIQLPGIIHQSVHHNLTDVILRWSAPNIIIPNIEYGIYYGTTLDELFESKFSKKKKNQNILLNRFFFSRTTP